MTYLCDNRRHLVCVPYNEQNLHRMASHLGLGRHWFHRDHYDIPKTRIGEIQRQCVVVPTRTIIQIIPTRTNHA